MHDDDSTPTRSLTASDLVIADLAASEAALTREVRELAADLHVYRELCQIALHRLADVTDQRDRAARVIVALRDELRRYTASAVLGRAA